VIIHAADDTQELTVIIPEFMEGMARSSSRMSDIWSPVRYPRFGDVVVTVVEATNNKRLHSGRIGMELILAACAPEVKEGNTR
jgi:hypothetical protein